MKNYIRRIRQKLGKEHFIHPAARIIIENTQQQVLTIIKADTGQMGVPAGAFEEGEDIEACIKREVQEETGLILNALEVIGISSNPAKETVQYPNGDLIQYFTIEFYSNDWSGNLEVQDWEEVSQVKFVDREHLRDLPPNERSALESLEYFRRYKKIMVK